jgi:hypothetical protein
MNFIYRHIVLLGRAIALLLFMSSLGFTAVLEICCELDGVETHLIADAHSIGEESAVAAQPTFTSPGNECHTMVLAGGLNGIPAVLEKDSKLNNSKPDVLLVLVAHDTPYLPLHVTTYHSYLVLSGNPSPAPVEKYVLNASFLI